MCVVSVQFSFFGFLHLYPINTYNIIASPLSTNIKTRENIRLQVKLGPSQKMQESRTDTVFSNDRNCERILN